VAVEQEEAAGPQGDFGLHPLDGRAAREELGALVVGEHAHVPVTQGGYLKAGLLQAGAAQEVGRLQLLGQEGWRAANLDPEAAGEREVADERGRDDGHDGVGPVGLAEQFAELGLKLGFQERVSDRVDVVDEFQRGVGFAPPSAELS
jgi:hypothetical protein